MSKRKPAPEAINASGLAAELHALNGKLKRKLREQAFSQGLRPWYEHLALRAWSWVAQRPSLYAKATRFAARQGKRMGGRTGLISHLPFGGGWTEGRDLPVPEGRTFRDLYQERQGTRS